MKSYSILYLLFLLSPSVSIGLKREPLVNTAYNVYHVYEYVSIQKNCYETYENMVNQMTKIKNTIEYAGKMNEKPSLPKNLLNDFQQTWVKLGNYLKNDPTLNKENLMENIFDKKNSNDIKIELNSVESKLHETMFNRVERMVIGEITKTVARTIYMIVTVNNTVNLIKQSKQFRESIQLQKLINKTTEYLDQAEKHYQIVDDEIQEIEKTFFIYIKENQLENIALHLKIAKLECENAEKELNWILNDIQQHMKSLISNKNNYFYDIASSLIDLGVTVYEYICIPTSILSKTAKLLFAGNTGLRMVNIVGYSIGFYWTQEEITKLEEYQNTCQNLKIKITDSFSKVNYGMGKLEIIKQHFKSSTYSKSTNNE
ncbi:hypothetical protein I4U23_004909 [Adineta vaga]|nr:hypothetical protein I4U23_004909 [Adineta vaga]